MISDSINPLRVYDNRIKGNQVGNEKADWMTFVEDIK
jgi:hypothetical protein